MTKTVPTTDNPDHSKVLDYFKYTMALAVGLVVYAPTTFLPATGWRYGAVALVFALAVVSTLAALAVFGALNRLLSGKRVGPDLPGRTDLLGWVHLGTLAAAFAVTFVFFTARMFGAEPEDPADCTVTLAAADSDGNPAIVEIELPCRRGAP